MSFTNATMKGERNFYHYKKPSWVWKKDSAFPNFSEYMILRTESSVENQYKLLNTIKPLTHKLLWDNHLQLAIIHGNPTVSGRKFQVTFCLLFKKKKKIYFTFTVGAAESDYTFGQLLWTRWHSRLRGFRMTCSLQINSDLIAAWRSQKNVISNTEN